MTENYPFDAPYWNVQDQRYWCKMWGYGYRGVKEPFLFIITEGRCATFEAEYQAYLDAQSGV